ncbi:sulfur carrier protein ThiS [Kocuria tytonis]|uniref:Sulfur carrier protein ThiS n=1 Tax=Kocuria tytonis TaxID=2054280 RepID=A0A495AC00_9MICC|nr:sulfur carrier protein ThiS [Kocuria tytonis]RKQ37074.1 sulfur carrier protein ThiS [Kocuria tytonis]
MSPTPAPHDPRHRTGADGPDPAHTVPAAGEFPPPPAADTATGAGTATVNGTPVEVHDGFTLTAAVSHLTGREITPEGTAADGHPLGIAVAVDDAVIPRSLWSATAVAAGQSVEIVTAVQGG